MYEKTTIDFLYSLMHKALFLVKVRIIGIKQAKSPEEKRADIRN